MKYTVKVYKKIMETEVEAESLISAKKQVEDILDKDKDLILRVSIPQEKPPGTFFKSKFADLVIIDDPTKDFVDPTSLSYNEKVRTAAQMLANRNHNMRFLDPRVKPLTCEEITKAVVKLLGENGNE
ncbi:hypothetical protein [Methanobacterium paludis]|uniref:Uncharacterized protein n=1 Tax=Methanobacterium paludis (strain DSM 25820 / JCM 18151 / SWAN1) TaxID=868131 RepID=F6D2V7_METPW|nr:hypothetical protein [Methanobacterium paludis]AEG18686.1 hypothetical protein MSWAN_1675 [Methanobacterium paludis]